MNVAKEKIQIKAQARTTIVGDFYDNEYSDAGVFLFPGFTEHRSSLEALASQLRLNFKVWTFDINSQGESTGIFDLNEMSRSIYEISSQLQDKHQLTKIGAFGNSLGGMAVGIRAAMTKNIFDAICITSAPAGLQDSVPKWAYSVAKHIPNSLVRQGLIAYDKLESARNENYRIKTHSQFRGENGYNETPQFGALKIKDVKQIAEAFENAPRLDSYVQYISAPTLMMYGGESTLFGIKGGKLPDSITNMYFALGKRSQGVQKEIIIVNGADHSLNKTTKIDDCFNQDAEFQYVKGHISDYFVKYLGRE